MNGEFEMKYARDLKVGDKVNGHMYGWMIVKEIKKQKFQVKVKYETMFGAKYMAYLSDDPVESI